MFNIISSFIEAFLNLVYKKKCLVCSCSKTDELLCKNCAKDVEYLSSFPHSVYKNIPIFSAFHYQTTIKKLIHSLKFQHRKTASKPLAQLLLKYFKRIDSKYLYSNDKNINSNNYIIVYPPSFFLKSAQRGYEHMFLIAKEFSLLSKIPVEKNLIKKIKYTKPQYKAKDRHKNIKDSFEINKKLSKDRIKELQSKNILILDDITTSGATIEAIVDCLLEKEFKNIICLTISKANLK